MKLISILLFSTSIVLAPLIGYCDEQTNIKITNAIEQLKTLKPNDVQFLAMTTEGGKVIVEGYANTTVLIAGLLKSITEHSIGVPGIREISSVEIDGRHVSHFVVWVKVVDVAEPPRPTVEAILRDTPAPEKAAAATSASTPSDAYPALPNWASDSLEMVVAKDAKSNRRFILHFNPTPDLSDVGDAGGWFMVVDESGKQLIPRMSFPTIHYYSVLQPNADRFEEARHNSHGRPFGDFPYSLTTNGKYGFILVGKKSRCLDTVLFFNADNGYIHTYEFPPKCGEKEERFPGYAFVTEDGLALLAEASESTCMMSGVICEPKFIYGFNLNTRARLMPKQFPKYRSLECNCDAY